MSRYTTQQKIYGTLRLAVAMCFIGHGAFGIITKPIWCNYFAVFGIGHETSYQLMPLLGSFDLLMGIGMLIYPIRAIPMWLFIWGLFTAFLRPLSGEPFAEFIERAGNFGAPLALLLLLGGIEKNIRNLFSPIQADFQMDAKTYQQVLICLKTIVFLSLAGHGWLNMIEKKGLVSQYLSLGFSHAGLTALTIGIIEINAAFLVFLLPYRPLIGVFFIWKISSELFYPHYELFEWIERGGSYGVLLALWFAMDPKVSFQDNNCRVPALNYS
jgi:hypothetical protein